MYRTAVIGDRDSIYGFAALGLDTFPVTDPTEAARRLRKLAEGEYAVIYITEALAAALETEIDRYRAERLPAIIPIPGVSGNTGMGCWLRYHFQRRLRVKQVKKRYEHW